MLALQATSFSQKMNDSIPSVQKDYLQKSKNQKTAAWILLGGGAALMTTSLIMAVPKVTSLDPESDYTAENILLVTGTAATLGSIPLFISSGKNKRKAVNLNTSIQMEKATILERQSFVQSSYPAFTLKINL
jgi:hypothetical protein